MPVTPEDVTNAYRWLLGREPDEAVHDADRLDESAGRARMVIRERAEGLAAGAAALGRDLAAAMLARGAARLIGATTNKDDAHD